MGGIETFLLSLVQAPGRHTHEHALAFDDVLASRLRAAGATVHLLGPVRLRHPWSVRRARARLSQVLERGDHAAVVAHGAWPYGLARRPARQRRRALCLFAHGPPVNSWLERWAFRRPPDLLLANSRFTAGQFRSRWSDLPAHVIHPVPLPPGALGPDQRRSLRAGLGAAPDELVVVCVGRIDPCKGHDDLLTALSLLPAGLPWRAWIVGGAQTPAETALQGRLRARAAATPLRGRVQLLGARQDVAALLAAADVYCQPNVSPDSFGLTFVEAMQAGLPVVTSALGGALEVLGPQAEGAEGSEGAEGAEGVEAGAVGVLLPPASPERVAGALLALLNDPARRARLGALGRERARALTDPARALARLEDALERAVRGEGRSGP